MNPKTSSITSRVWLDGNPVFSLTYEGARGVNVYNDLLGFRPDPSDYLIPGVKYHSHLVFHAEKDFQNKDQWVLRYVYIKSLDKSGGPNTTGLQKFAYIR